MRDRLRSRLTETALPPAGPEAWQARVVEDIAAQGVAFVATDPRMEVRFAQAFAELLQCIKPTADARPILNEGGIYYGCWLESTGTINAEILSRFAPQVAHDTFASFADYQRADGCLPYKLTTDGPVFSQIQLVTPPARSVWTHVGLHSDAELARRMTRALAAYDDWLATHRNTGGTGCIEAFCAFDTGHDLSSRFWHVPDSPTHNDPGQVLDDHPMLPFAAPDLTAATICGRRYLARLSGDPAWLEKADAMERALFATCWDEADGFFYDRDRMGHFVRVQSDILLRVLACEVGDDGFFDEVAQRTLLSTRKFFAKYPFTSVALDDPRFDPHFHYNSWAGPSNFLSLIRAPVAFEAHGRSAEFVWTLYPILSALFAGDRFPQCLSPYTGEMGFTEVYSPAILCLLDYVERLSGILPQPDGTLWIGGLVPRSVSHRDTDHGTAYARLVDGARFEVVNAAGHTHVFRDGDEIVRAPMGLRLVLGRDGTLRELIGLRSVPVKGTVVAAGRSLAIDVGPNARFAFDGFGLEPTRPASLLRILT